MSIITNFNLVNEINKVIKDLPKSSIIVYTYGAWDLLHPGHLQFLKRAKSLGNFLIVGIISDKQIRDFKGKDRPVQNEKDRKLIISNLRMVDAVIPQENYDPSKILKELERVSILTKGDDWDYIPGQETIVDLGGELVKLGYTDGFSTSSLVSIISGKPKKSAGQFKK